MQYTIQLQDISDIRPLAVVRRRASLPQLPKVIPESCGTVWNALRAQNIRGAGRHVSVYLDDQINLEVGVELHAPFTGFGEVVASKVPQGRVASTVHFGPYGQLHEAHHSIRDWCKLNSHSLAGPYWEIYGHWEDAWNTQPGQIRTDVFYLLDASSV